MGCMEESAAKRAHARETERALERERERTREKDTSRSVVFATKGLPVTPVDSSLERGAKPKLQQGRVNGWNEKRGDRGEGCNCLGRRGSQTGKVLSLWVKGAEGYPPCISGGEMEACGG